MYDYFKIYVIMTTVFLILASIMDCTTSWCGRGDKPRTFPQREVQICYNSPASAKVDRTLYNNKRFEALTGQRVVELEVPKKSARTFTMLQGDLCRISISEGPQVNEVIYLYPVCICNVNAVINFRLTEN